MEPQPQVRGDPHSQRIYSFHTGADRVFGGEDGIAGRLGELANEGEVHGVIRYDQRAVRFLAGLEESIDIGHIAGGGVAAFGSPILDLVCGHTI